MGHASGFSRQSLGGPSLALPLHHQSFGAVTGRGDETMAIEIRGVPVGRGLRARILTQLTAALAQLGREPAAARATFFDENGPKGGLALRCALTVRVPHRPIVRVEEAAVDPRTAFDGAFAKLERDLEQHGDREREAKRHPKKYYVARRMIAAEGTDTDGKRRRQRAVRRGV